MEWLNYHHLLYFRTVVREGSVQAAARRLGLSQPTISAQVRALQRDLGEDLFDRSGRRLALTEAGRLVFRYADEIFSIGSELKDTLRRRLPGRRQRLAVGVADVVPKAVAHRVLRHALALPDAVRLVVREDRADRLLAEMAIHELDVVISDAPMPEIGIRGRSRPLGDCGVSLVAAPALATRLAPGFPASLDGAPVLLPAEGTGLRRAVEEWLDWAGVRPRVVAELDDSALMRAFGQEGAGAFPVPASVLDAVARESGVAEVGTLEGVRARYWAITPEGRLRHPAVEAVLEATL